MNMRIAAIVSAVGGLAGLAHAQIADGGFEMGFASPWIQTSTNFGTPLCDGGCLGGPTGARTGTWWAWFGGIDSALEMGSLTQTVSIPAGNPTLQFYLVGYAAPANPNVDFLRVLVGGNQVFYIDDDEMSVPGNPYSLDYVLVSVDLTPWAGTTQAIRFESTTNGQFYLTNYWVDDVSIEAGTGPTCYANCDLSTSPPILNVADFGCFLTKFAAGDSYANCDESTTVPVLNVADFGCFLTKFAAGCP